ncbi:TetR family transcriptional regulator [Arthrobacter sp. MYb23]|uniref:TetR/AcrR family transcriptional regulator n=1 Tax=unclassified Arthrobacter TaxID=235627 RepID=UPI000CFC0CB1|nr:MULTISPECIES: TetR family transcriptional regulator C-terminal domain-containing protein [unclassified Arthrobacter]PRB38957.1 TetR family transcriptional regulator [Arthrobacter sp. MYb51]PRB92963.1 TetR family transcriptional regulator [Arthrobacter sp. MYb23]
MPRRIDAEARTAAIADASLRVLERDGLSGLSVRGVAAEAGIAAASLRRAFATQHALREYCLQLIENRVIARVMALEVTGRALVDELLLQLLPLDKERRLELVAQVQLGVLSLTDSELRPAAVRLSDGVARASHAAIQILTEAGQFHRGRDPEYEAQRLRALLDGIAMGGLWSGELPASSELPTVLARHLDQLAEP